MCVLIVEYVSGGGLEGRPLLPTMFLEAAMLHAAVADFRALDRWDVITTRDPRLEGERPGAFVHPIQPRGFDDTFRACSAARDADATVMAIHPRLTTVHPGLRRVPGVSLAAVLRRAAQGVAPESLPSVAQARVTASAEVRVEPLHGAGA